MNLVNFCLCLFVGPTVFVIAGIGLATQMGDPVQTAACVISLIVAIALLVQARRLYERLPSRKVS